MNCFHVSKVENGIVYLVDDSGDTNFKTITNDAENVLAVVCKKYGFDKRAVYLDTDNEWWEIKHNGGIFESFAPYWEE